MTRAATQGRRTRTPGSPRLASAHAQGILNHPNRTRRSLPRLTGEERCTLGKKMREHYEEGMSIRQIAGELAGR